MKTPKKCAEHMVKKYGQSKGLDWANHYALMSRFDMQDKIPGAENNNQYWNEVIELIKNIGGDNGRDQ